MQFFAVAQEGSAARIIGMEKDAHNTQEMLVANLLRRGALRTKSVIQAFSEIDRRDFVPQAEAEMAYAEMAYKDIPISIGHGQTISQPSVVAFMLELLEVRRGHRVLDIGSGSGWTTALLAQLTGATGMVHGVEIIPELVLFGRANLGKYDFPQAHIRRTGNSPGDSVHGSYNRILVSASARFIPQAFLRQLADGGIMVIPVENDIQKIAKKSSGEIVREIYSGYTFVPLVLL